MKLIPSESSAPTQLLSRQHFVRISPLAATLMDLPASVANKRLTAELSPLAATLTKNRGVGGAPLFARSDNDAHPEFANGGGAEGFFSGLTLLYCCAPRAFHNSFTTKRFRTLSQNCRGVAQQFPFWELFAGHSAERPLFSSSLFYGLHTLPSFVSRNSFACHWVEKSLHLCLAGLRIRWFDPIAEASELPKHLRSAELLRSFGDRWAPFFVT